MRLKWLFFVSLAVFFLSVSLKTRGATVPSAPPVLFFSDLVSGPASGNSDKSLGATGGAYVTLYGNFLDNFSSVKLNGASCLTIVSNPTPWLWYERMVVKLGTSCTSGNWSIATPNGTFNGPMQSTSREQRSVDFKIVPGHIYYVAASGGSDSSDGSFGGKWASLPHAKLMMVNGDITYAMNGYSENAPDPDHGWGIITLTPSTCASPGAQIAMAVYPGATVTIGSVNNDTAAVRPFDGGCTGYTFVGMTFRGRSGALDYGSGGAFSIQNIRSVGNDVSCPNANSATGCEGDGSTDTAHQGVGLIQYGNNFHDIGTGNNSLQHAIYHGNTVSIIDAWNNISNVTGACRGIQVFSSTSGYVHTDIHIHDNVIHDTGCDAIGLYDTQSTGGGIYGGGAEIYNNVIYRSGQNGAGGSANSMGIYYSIDNGPSSSSVVEIYNNTVYDVNGISGGGHAAIGCALFGSAGPRMHIHNNLIYQVKSSAPYFDLSACGASNSFGENNLVFGIGSIGSECPNCTGTLGNVNPGLVNTSESGCPLSCATNLHLSSATSPANGAGFVSAVVPGYDHDGLIRGSPLSIGAYEFAPGSAVAVKPNPPTNLQVVVN
jgi:hypothetical protein